MSTIPRPRLRSLDAFRGLAVAAMIVVNNPGTDTGIYSALIHSAWDGWTFADTIAPAFLWIVGLSMTIATAGRLQGGDSRSEIVRHAIRRAVVLFGCGLFIEAFPAFDLANIQLTGLLQEIAVSYLLAFVIFVLMKWPGQLVAIIVLNAAYIALMVWYPVPGCDAGPWDVMCNVARYANESLLHGHLWHQPALNDPDGLVTVLPATTTVLFGALAGRALRLELPNGRIALILLASGCTLFATGHALAHWIPINKTLWTSSFVALMAGLSSIVFAVLYWIIDIRRSGPWLRPFEILGMNALAAYMLSRVVLNIFKVHVFGMSLYSDVFARVAAPPNASLLFALMNVAAIYVAAWVMYRRGWFIRL
jgi:predicted acyltransferase